MLFLKRNNKPHNWCPPCGRVEPGEDPVTAIIREIREETGLEAEAIMPVDTNIAEHDGKSLLSISYVCKAKDGDLKLSDEHSEHRWIPIDSLGNIELDTNFDTKRWPLFIKTARFFKTIIS